ncbi:cytochrome P450 [Streptomyces sp. XM4193]|uniref:cytochrome P450 family protein n=1 Tax=Streptomyces sp. XM4193 TaxID=2929782 RepID=UPI001FF71A88|nr:cytochrome P450 [Streptomyces sp. XM4193]MCK1795921.1 cytochrome P450 [Streptomyces sp. XM4193]
MNTPHRMDPQGGCPHAANARLLARGPVAEVILPGEVEGMAVLGHEELKEFLTHEDVAKNAEHFTALQEGRIPEGWPLHTFTTVAGMTTADGADHRRLRSLVSRAFTQRRVEALRPRVEELTGSLLDNLAAAAEANDGVADLRRNFAFPLPMSVICELLGVDPGNADKLHSLTTHVVSTSITPEEVIASNKEMVGMLAQHAAARVADPKDDLTNALITAREEDGDRLSESELIGTLLLLIIAGHETTLNLVTNAVRALCAHRDQLELVLRGEATWLDVVEETLRYDAPVAYFPFRYPTRDLEIGGTVIPQGTPVLAGYAAAGRDERAHGERADTFDVTREDSRNLSLGHGPHYCLGAPLARMEATIALERLFTRFPDLDVAEAEKVEPRRGSFVGNSVVVLPVRLGEDRLTAAAQAR